MSSQLRPWRLALASIAVGVTWYFFVRLGASVFAEFEQLRWPLGLRDLYGATLFALAVLAPAWLFRRALAALPLSATFPATVLALFLFSACLVASDLAVSSLLGGVEELQDLHGLLEHILMPVLIVLLGTVGVLSTVAQAFYVSLPLAWLGVWVLWRASGAPQEAPRLRAKQA